MSTWNTYSSGRLFRMQFKCVSCTPFGIPVVPDEYKMNAVSLCPWTCAGSNLFMSTLFVVTNVLIDISDSSWVVTSSSAMNFFMQSKLFSTSLYVFQKWIEHMKYFGCVMDILCFNAAEMNEILLKNYRVMVKLIVNNFAKQFQSILYILT